MKKILTSIVGPVVLVLLLAAGCNSGTQTAGVKLPPGAKMGPGTYTNAKYGFSLQYGSGWFAREKNTEWIGFCKVGSKFGCVDAGTGITADVVVEVQSNPQQNSVKDYLLLKQGVDVSHQPKGSGISNITVAGSAAVQISAAGGVGSVTYISHGAYVLVFTGSTTTADLNSIMNTLQFTK